MSERNGSVMNFLNNIMDDATIRLTIGTLSLVGSATYIYKTKRKSFYNEVKIGY